MIRMIGSLAEAAVLVGFILAIALLTPAAAQQCLPGFPCSAADLARQADREDAARRQRNALEEQNSRRLPPQAFQPRLCRMQFGEVVCQ